VNGRFQGVLFDLGGVVLGSPLHAIERFERQRGIELGFVNRLVAASAPDGAWHRLERGELTLSATFYESFDRECATAGQALDSRSMFEAIAAEARLRPQMLAAIARLRVAGLRVGALTNNWVSDGNERRLDGAAEGTGEPELRARFDVYVESSVVGLRKPDPRIYVLACRELGTEPQRTVFLDDIGANLKAARALGLATIKVNEPDAALDELWRLVGLG
jgi:putative hydrolase of the HAD superfamily